MRREAAGHPKLGRLFFIDTLGHEFVPGTKASGVMLEGAPQ